MRNHFYLILLLLSLSFPAQAKKELNGELEIISWVNPDSTVSIPLMKLRYSYSQFFGEPIEKFIFYWEGGDEFTEINSIQLVAQVFSAGKPQDAYVEISPSISSQKKWSWDMPGSPDWNEVFAKKNGEFIDEKTTKSYFKNDFSLGNMQVQKISAYGKQKDEAYQALTAYFNQAHVIEANQKSPLDGKLPVNWGFSGWGFWNERINSSDIINELRNTRFEGQTHLLIQESNRVSWKYGQYQHAVLDIQFSNFTRVTDTYERDKNRAGEVEIEVVWSDWATGNVYEHQFKRSVKRGQRLVVADRIRRPEKKDGSLVHYQVSYIVRYSLKDIDNKDKELLEALDEDQRTRFDETLEQHNIDAKAVKKDNAYYQSPEGKRALALKAEQERIRQEKERIRREEAQRLVAEEKARKAEEVRLELARQRKLQAQERARIAQLAEEKRQRELLAWTAEQKKIDELNRINTAKLYALRLPNEIRTKSKHSFKLFGRVRLSADFKFKSIRVLNRYQSYVKTSALPRSSGKFSTAVYDRHLGAALRPGLNWIEVQLKTDKFYVTKGVAVYYDPPPKKKPKVVYVKEKPSRQWYHEPFNLNHGFEYKNWQQQYDTIYFSSDTPEIEDESSSSNVSTRRGCSSDAPAAGDKTVCQ
jgi:hypothetical protein